MYNTGNDRINGADEIMRRLMDITGRGMAEDSNNNDTNNGLRSIHGVPEGIEEDGWAVPTLSSQRPQKPPCANMPCPPRPQKPPVRPEIPQPSKPQNNCGCKRPGYAYVLRQEFEDVYDPATSLKRGTMFKSLDLPKNVYGMEEN